jgi:hypothetical protein
MAFRNKETTLILPEGASTGPRIELNGDVGKIIVYGANDADRIEINPTIAGGSTPVINMQNSATPGDTRTGLRYNSGIGPMLESDPSIHPVSGEEVRARLTVSHTSNLNEYTVRRTASPFLKDGGSVSIGHSHATMSVVHAGVNQIGFVQLNTSELLLSANGTTGDKVTFNSPPYIFATPDPGRFMTRRHRMQTSNTTTSATYVAGANTNGLVFKAPPSGNVEIHFGGWLGSSATTIGRRAFMSVEVRAGETIGSGAVQFTAGSNGEECVYYKVTTTAAFQYGHISRSFLLGGLTYGSTYNIRTMFRSDTAGDTSAVQNRYVMVKPVAELIEDT